MTWQRFVWLFNLAIALRLLLLLLGAGDWLIWRPEVSTPANTVLKTREGLWLLQYGLSPYQGASCHIPPLWLAITAPLSQHKVLYAVPNIVCDLLAAASILLASAALFRPSALMQHKRDAPWFQPQQLSLLYLFNPFSVLSCVAGTTTSAENMAVMLAVAGGILRNGPLAGVGVAVGAYIGLHPLILTVPISLLLRHGAEDVLQQVQDWPLKQQHNSQQRSQQEAAEGRSAVVGNDSQAADTDSKPSSHNFNRKHQLQQREADIAGAAEGADAAAVGAVSSEHAAGDGDGSATSLEHHQQQQRRRQIKRARGTRLGRLACLSFFASVIFFSLSLLLLSDMMLQQHPQAQCLPAAVTWLQGKLLGQNVQHVQQQLVNSCWGLRVYRFTLLLEDYTPTIGLWWYFFTEMFDAFRPFFLFVFHSFAVFFTMPLAVRFPNHPLFVTWAQLFIICMFKPYACVGDMVPWMALLPLLQQQLQCIKLGLFFVNSFVLLIVLGPSMWHQWIVVDAANSNFFYSITLLLGLWYTVFLVQMLRFTVLLDRRLAGKDHLLPDTADRKDKR